MLGEIGTLAWTRRTNGLMSRSERARYVAAAMREQAVRGPRLLAWRLGRGDGTGEIDEEAMRIPDSKLAREAIERVRARHPRLRFTQESIPILGAQARAIPRCRTAAVMQAGFGLALRLGPWRD